MGSLCSKPGTHSEDGTAPRPARRAKASAGHTLGEASNEQRPADPRSAAAQAAEQRLNAVCGNDCHRRWSLEPKGLFASRPRRGASSARTQRVASSLHSSRRASLPHAYPNRVRKNDSWSVHVCEFFCGVPELNIAFPSGIDAVALYALSAGAWIYMWTRVIPTEFASLLCVVNRASWAIVVYPETSLQACMSGPGLLLPAPSRTAVPSVVG